jgi:hypothetical protein
VLQVKSKVRKGEKTHNPCKMEPTDAKERKKQAGLLAGWLAGWLAGVPTM